MKAAANSPSWIEPCVTSIVWAGAAFVGLAFFWIVGDVFWKGIDGISWAYLTKTAINAGRAGGIGPIIVSTLLILGVCMASSVPLAFATAVLLAEFTPASHGFGRLIRMSLDTLAGVPSIVFGLFGNAFFCIKLGLGFSILSGGLTLACMVLPIMIRSIELGLRSVSDDYRLAGAALAISRTTLMVRVLIPVAAPGIAAGLMLGIGRALAETAALIFTSGYVDRMPESLTDSGRALSIHIYDLAMNVAGGEPNAYASALVLILILIFINWVAYALTDRLIARRVRTV